MTLYDFILNFDGLGTGPIAYIGPGAGIALVGSFLAVLFALMSALIALFTWPLRWEVSA